MNSIVSLIMAAGGFAADRAVKSKIEKELAEGEERSYFGGRVVLQKTVNRGFAMNTCENKRGLVIGLSLVVFCLSALVYISLLCDERGKALRASMAILMAGAAGNMYDRLRKGYVVDYIRLSCLKKIVFNLADVFIVTGSLLCLLKACSMD